MANNKKTQICVVTVTYGDRFHLLKEIVDACFKEGVNKIIIIDNNSAENSKKQLRELEKKEINRLKVIYLSENKGSAGGYKRGLIEAYKCEDCEYIYLLDDDNKPVQGAIDKLIEFWQRIKLPEEEKRKKVALLSYREDKEICKLIKLGKDYRDWIKRSDYFLGFHMLDIPHKLATKLIKIFNINTNKSGDCFRNELLMPYAPYGGLFFHKSLLDEIGYPNEIFFTYADDHEFTYRIVLRGGKIFLVPDSIVVDIDKSWNQDVLGLRNLIPSLLRGNNNYRVYLTVRNRIFFERMYFRKNKIFLFFNKVLYLTYLGCMALLAKKFGRFKRILDAIETVSSVEEESTTIISMCG